MGIGVGKLSRNVPFAGRLIGALLCSVVFAAALPRAEAIEPAAPAAESESPLTAAPANEATNSANLLSLDRALAIVWSQNPQVQQAQLALKATDYEVSGSKVGYYPSVVVQQEQDKNGNSGLIRLIQPLWNGGYTGAQVDISRSTQSGALADLNRTRLELGLRTSEIYLNLVGAQELSTQWLNYQTELEKLHGIIERRATEGVAPKSDIETIRTRISQARAGYQANRALVESNRAQLATLINRLPENVDWPGANQILSDEEVKNAGRVGIDAHPQLQLAMAEVRHQKATARAAKAQLWPQVNAEYRRALKDFSTDSGNDDSALLTLQYQTDSGLRAYQQYSAEKERTGSAKAKLEAARRDIDATIRTAKAERAVALLQIEVQAEAVQSTRSLTDSFLRQFDAGRKTWLEVLNALREYNDTELQLTSAKRNFWVANSRLSLQGLYWRRLSGEAPTIDVIQMDNDDE